MRAGLSESPVSIREAFPSPGTKRNKPKNARPEVKQRMTALRSPIGINMARAKPASDIAAKRPQLTAHIVRVLQEAQRTI
jgi:hypothetical protein